MQAEKIYAGERVRFLRAQPRLRQSELARALFISPSYLNQVAYLVVCKTACFSLCAVDLG
jgi:hypothetical protein